MAENHHNGWTEPEGPPAPAGGPLPVSPTGEMRLWTALLLVGAVVIAFYWTLVLTNQFTWLAGSDTVKQVLPWFQFQAGEWHKGRPPLWDPFTCGGQPLAGQAIPQAMYPPNWILYSLPLRDGWMKQIWLQWYFVGIHLLAAMLAYLLARELRVDRMSAAFGGAVFSLAGWMVEIQWPQMLNGAIWVPLVLLFLMRVARDWKPAVSAALGGFFLGFAWLSGHHQIPLFASLAAAAIWIWLLAGNWRLGGACILFWAMAFSAGALQILPAWEYGHHAVRWVGAAEPVGWATRIPYEVHKSNALSPISLLGILIPGSGIALDAFTGVTVFGLALIGAIAGWRRREGRVMVAVGLGGLLFALAQHNAMHGVLYSLVPMVEKARSPAMAVMLFGLAAAMLAAMGMDAMARGVTRNEDVRRFRLAVLWFAAGVVAIRFGLVMTKGWPGSPDDSAMVTGLASLLLGGLLYGWQRGAITPQAFKWGLLGLFLVEAGNAASGLFPTVLQTGKMAALNSMREHSDVAQFLRGQNHPFRVQVDEKAAGYNFGDWYGIEQVDGYLTGLTNNAHRHFLTAPSTRRLLGVEFLVAKEPAEPYNRLVFKGASGVNVYWNPDVLPRVFAVHESKQDANLVEGTRALGERLGKSVLLAETAPNLEQCSAPDLLRVTRYNASAVEVKANMGCRGMAILGDIYYPGWEARVDGSPAKIWEADGLVRGVVVERGAHTIEFRYRPGSVYWGAGLSAAALLAAIAFGVAGLRRRHV